MLYRDMAKLGIVLAVVPQLFGQEQQKGVLYR